MSKNERLKQNDLFSTIKRNNISDNTITVFVHNARSLSKHINDIACNDRIINKDIIAFTEIQINLSDSSCKIMETFKFFRINFDNDRNKFLSLAYECRNDVLILDKFDTNGVLIFSFKKHAFADREFTLMLLYRNNPCRLKNFFKCCNI